MKTNFHDRLDEAVKSRKLSKAAASEAARLHRDTVGKILSKRDSWPTIETVEKLADGLGLRPEYLAYGVGNLEDTKKQSIVTGLPVLGDVQTGIWVEAEARNEDGDRVPVAPDIRFPLESQFILVPRGTSMNNIFGQGDLIHCVSTERGAISARDGDIVIVERRRMNGEVETSAKRLVRIDGRQVAVPDSSDERWSNFRIALDDADDGETIAITAVVIRVVKELLK